MNLNRKDFSGVIQRVASLVKGRSTLPILSMVKLEASNGRFNATASDLDCFVKASCDCDGELEVCLVAPGPLLALSSYGPDQIHIELVQTRLKVVSGATARLSVMSAKEFPLWPVGLKDLGVNPSDLADGINAVSWAADSQSQESAMRRAVSVSLVTKDNKLVVCACDGKELAYFSKAAVVPNTAFVVMAQAVAPLCEALKGINPTLQLNDAWVAVKSQDFDCALRLVEGKFPNVKPILGEEATFVCELPREPVLEALVAMKACHNGDGYAYGACSAVDNGLEFEFAGKTNDFRAVVECVLADKPKAPVHYDAIRLHDLLKHTPGEKVRFLANDLQMRFESGDVTAILAQIRGQQ